MSGGLRWRNAIVPKDYVERTRRPAAPHLGADDGITITAEELGPDALLRERIMLGLRMAEGLDLAKASTDLGVTPSARHEQVARQFVVGEIERGPFAGLRSAHRHAQAPPVRRRSRVGVW